MTTSMTAVREYDAIATTITRYVAGGRSGRGAHMQDAFHPDATIFGSIGPELFADPIRKPYDWNDENRPAAGLQARTASVDVADTIDTVRLELDGRTGHCFTDLFTPLKVDGEWKIISKVFHLHA